MTYKILKIALSVIIISTQISSKGLATDPQDNPLEQLKLLRFNPHNPEEFLEQLKLLELNITPIPTVKTPNYKLMSEIFEAGLETCSAYLRLSKSSGYMSPTLLHTNQWSKIDSIRKKFESGKLLMKEPNKFLDHIESVF